MKITNIIVIMVVIELLINMNVNSAGFRNTSNTNKSTQIAAVASVSWMKDGNYADGNEIKYSNTYRKIFKDGDYLYPRVKIIPTTQPVLIPNTIQVKISLVRFDINQRQFNDGEKDFALTLQSNQPDANGAYTFYPSFRIKISSNPETGVYYKVISGNVVSIYDFPIVSGSDGVKEYLTVDTADNSLSGIINGNRYTSRTSDSENFKFGVKRGEGRDLNYVDYMTGDYIGNLDFFKTAGLELLSLEVNDTFVTDSGVRNKRANLLIANQADVLYYSGHGDSKTNSIYYINDVNKHTACTVGDFDTKSNWNDDLDVLVIAGCSVLNIRSLTQSPDLSVDGNNGQVWAEHCMSVDTYDGAHLKALCGYYGSAPADLTPYNDTDLPNNYTTKIARKFSETLLDNNNYSNTLEAWRDAHEQIIITRFNWCALDNQRNYWYCKDNGFGMREVVCTLY